MTNIQIFNNTQFGQVRAVTIDGEPWFVGKDVAEKLGYTHRRRWRPPVLITAAAP